MMDGPDDVDDELSKAAMEARHRVSRPLPRPTGAPSTESQVNTIAWSGAVLVGLLVLWATWPSDSPFSPPKSPPNATGISAAALYEEFEGNLIDAEAKYARRRVRVYGEVTRVDRTYDSQTGMDSAVFVALKTNNVLGSVRCFLTSPASASGLRPGDTITVSGEPAAGPVGLTVDLLRAQILQR